MSLEDKFQAPLDLPWRPYSIHTRTQANAQRVASARSGCGRDTSVLGSTVDRACTSVKNAIDQVPRSIEIGEVENIVDSDRRLNRHMLLDPDRPAELRIGRLQPGQSKFSWGSQ